MNDTTNTPAVQTDINAYDAQCLCDQCCENGHCGCDTCDEPCDCAAPRTITVTYQVVLEVLDEDASLNHAIDAVSLAVWHIGDDRDDFRTLTASMITAQENTQEDHDNRTCGCCN